MNINPTIDRRRFTALTAGALFHTRCSKPASGRFYALPARTDRLILYDIADPPTLDPARSWGFLDGRLIGMIFSNLVRFDHQAQVAPDLAERWDISREGARYTFYIRKDAAFSQGRPVVSNDVKYSLERLLDSAIASPSRWIVETIERIETESDYEVTIHLAKPYAPFLATLAMPGAAIVPREEIERCEGQGIPFGEQPLGSGPWRFQEWKHDQHLLFARNERYWGTKPVLRELMVRIIGNSFTAIAEFETGRLAAINPLPTVEILRWTTHPDWSAHTQLFRQLNTDMVLFNCVRPPFDREEIRQALCRLVDTALVLQGVREGAGTVSYGPIPPGLPGHRRQPPEGEMSSDEARRIVREAGLAQRGLDLVMPARENFIRTAGEVLQTIWKQAGAPARLRQLEWVTYRRALREGQFDAIFRGWFADYPDGENFLFPLFHSSQIGANNMSNFSNIEVDRLIEASRHELNEVRRTEHLSRANDLIYRKAPALFLWHQAKYIVTQPWLKDFSEPLIFNGTRYLNERIELA